MSPIIFAMRRPVTVIVALIAVALSCFVAVRPKGLDEWLRRRGIELPLKRMPVDIFPALNLPVVYVCQPYGGMDPAQMEGLLTNYYEYHFLYINGIHHVESRNVQGNALMKLHFHPGTNMAQAMAETINYVNRSRAFMPPGTVSPFVMRFDTGSVPVGYLVLSSPTRTVTEIQDQALFKVRPMFSALPGVSAPPPFGGSARSIVVRADPDRLRACGVSPDDVIAALTTGNTISPSGNIHIGDSYPLVPMNAMVRDIRDLGNIPLKPGSSPNVYLRDIATIEDAADITTGYSLVNGRRAVYILATKRADASTMSVIDEIKRALPTMQKELPDDIRVTFEFDQSPYVTRAINSLLTEGVLGALLTGLMVLVFLRDWRSALVVVLNIPLAIMASIVALWVTGQTVNLMTLGGLALAVGILVDEATVEIENIHTQMHKTDSIAWAVRLGNAQTAIPRLLAMLCILAVFVPSFFMDGAPRALFVPLSLAVGFAMIASYILSSTFVPVAATWLLRSSVGVSPRDGESSLSFNPREGGEHQARVGLSPRYPAGSPAPGASEPQAPAGGESTSPDPNEIWLEDSETEPKTSVADLPAPRAANTPVPGAVGPHGAPSRLVSTYRRLLERSVAARWVVVPAYLAGCGLLILVASRLVGVEIFPKVDAGEFRIRMRAPDGTHIDVTEQYALKTLDLVKKTVGEKNVALTLGYIGTIPSSYPINAVYQFSRGPEEAILRVALKPRSGISTERMKETLRDELHKSLPELRCSFEPADIVSEVMSFGSPTPIEVALRGGNLAENRAFAEKVEQAFAAIPGLRDVQISQSLDYPTVDVKIDREKAGLSGVTVAQVSRSVLAATSSSRFVVPNYWPDPKTGIGYQVQVEIPQPRLKSVDDLGAVPVQRSASPQLLLRDVADISRGRTPGEYDRYNMKRELSLTASVAATDLGSVAQKVVRTLDKVKKLDDAEKDVLEKEAVAKGAPKPGRITHELRGQIPPLRQMTSGLGVGLLLAIVVIFLLLSANFQSFRLALTCVSTAPAVVAGVLLALLVTGSTINIQSFIGAIMGIGVAMANAILLVTFAEQDRRASGEARSAAVSGAAHRLRPIVMTSCAMLAGMLPLALGLGETGQQTAPLGRAVIGGLAAATAATLFILPAVFALLQSRATVKSASLDPGDPESRHHTAAPASGSP